MTNNDDRQPQHESYAERRRDTSIGPFIPLILVATFVFVMIDRRSDASDRQVVSGDAVFSDTAFLGGVQHNHGSSALRRGEAEAFMGGIDLDLRDAVIEGDEARLDVTAIMGGVKIRVPRTWNVVSRVTPIMGGVKDRTRSANGNKRLVIEGTVLMGGLHIDN